MWVLWLWIGGGDLSYSEEAAQEKAAVKTVQREMDEADEANLLEEEGNLLCITSLNTSLNEVEKGERLA